MEKHKKSNRSANTLKKQFSQQETPAGFGIRGKLIAIFIVIKVLPLIAIAFFAGRQIVLLGSTVKDKSEEIVGDTRALVTQIGGLASENSIKALDLKARDSIERLTTATARDVADFLYERDNDILLAADIVASKSSYQKFLFHRKKNVVYHEKWIQKPDGTGWMSGEQTEKKYPHVQATTPDNKKEFHYRKQHRPAKIKLQPLYHEMTFIDLEGVEKIKASATDLLSRELLNISQKSKTWCSAETYFAKIQSLKKGEIYVSRVIGPYIPSSLIGSFTKESAKKKGIPFEPEKAGYAGKENPVGKRFQGIVRWVTPVFSDGKKVGYVTLALDHTHLMEFTDHIVPGEKRFSDVSDAGSGNYAFMWDYEGRNISHPRDYFIVGYDTTTGEEAVPWLSTELFDLWNAMDNSFGTFEKIAPTFHKQSLAKTPAKELTAAGMLGLDCRYLNFAPQCSGWKNLTQYGGSGSFVIFWSKFWKLTTAAAIPYYTGQYKESLRGFGFVTIGANVDEFHSFAQKTASRIDDITREYEANLDLKKKETESLIDRLLTKTIQNLTASTGVMVFLVILIAIWMASTLTGKITTLIDGIKRFQAGLFSTHLKVESQDELGQLTQAFNEMSDTIEASIDELNISRDKAEESARAKSLFLANMSHEIRTPLSVIIGMNRLALDASANPEQHKLLESVKTSADSLLAVINDILDFSKIEADQLDLEKHSFSLHALVRSVVKSIAVLAENDDIEIGYGVAENVPEYVSGDNMRLRQILFNLLGNAVKFTKRGIVSLEVKSDKPVAGEVVLRFSVRDTGIGIDAEHLEMIFDSFSQSDVSIARKYQGTGLGLAISKKLCQLMDGDIGVESELGVGTTFSFYVVFEESDLEKGGIEKNEEKIHHSAMESLQILLVEDNEANRELARIVLEQSGHKVVTAESGIQALRKLSEKSFDIVVMDVQMPEMDGFTATALLRSCETGKATTTHIPEKIERRLRGRYYGHHQPIVALTAHAMRGDKEKCLAAGMDGYLTKPFLPDQVVSALSQFAGRSGEDNQVEQTGGSTNKDNSIYLRAKENLSREYSLEEEKIDSLLTTSFSIIREDLKKLTTAAAAQKIKQTGMIAHSLKGILLNLRLTDEAELANILHKRSEQEEWQEAVELVEKLKSSLQEIME